MYLLVRCFLRYSRLEIELDWRDCDQGDNAVLDRLIQSQQCLILGLSLSQGGYIGPATERHQRL